jgi:FO synthase
MNESISRAAGTQHGQELGPNEMERLIRAAGRAPQQRTTLYVHVSEERRNASFRAAPLLDPIQTPFEPKRAAAAG